MRRALIVLGSFAVTVLAAWLAFKLGAVGFDTRRFSQHERRLQRLLAQQPTLDRVVRGLEDEGSRLLAAPPNELERRRVAALHGGPRQPEVLDKGRRWPQTRVFLAGDMVYFIYFDEAGVMRDFTCVSRQLLRLRRLGRAPAEARSAALGFRSSEDRGKVRLARFSS